MKHRKLLLLVPFLLALAACSTDPRAQAQRFVEKGNGFYDKEKYKEASIMYRRAMQKDLRYGDAYYRLGLTDLKTGAYSDAVRMLVRAVELQPNNADAASKLADLYMLATIQVQDADRRDQLIKEIKGLTDKLFTQDAKSFDAHRLLGQIALLQRNPAEAITHFGQANQVKPNTPELIIAYYEALTANNQIPEAEQLARDFISKQKNYGPIYDMLYLQYAKQNKLAEAEAILKEKIANNPKNASFLLQLAGYYFLTKHRPEMENIIQKMSNEQEFPEGHLLAGDFFFFRLQEYDRARQQYEAAMNAFPKDRTIYQKRLVELLALTGKAPEAIQMVDSILKADPKDSDAVAMRAALQLTTGDRNQINAAVNDLQGLVNKTPDNHLLRYNLARALVARNETDSAIQHLQEAVKLRPDFIAGRIMLSRIYLTKGDAGRALKSADEVISLDRNNLDAHLVRSNALLGLNERDKAKEELDFIAKTFPGNLEARYQIAFMAFQQKDYKRAEELFGVLHKESPSDVRGLIGVVESAAAQGRMAQAVKDMEDAARKAPDRPELKRAVGNLYVRAQRFDDGISTFKSLLEKNPSSSDLLFRLGEAYRLKGDINSAIDTFRRATQAAPNDLNSLLQLSLMMEATGRRNEARPLYEQILKVQPDQAIALNNLAFLKADEGGDLDQALTMAQKAKQVLPGSPDVSDTLGWIYIKKNLSDDAVRVFQELVQKSPNNHTYRYHFGMALLQKGDKPSAKRELETAIRNNPSKEEVGKIKELLARI